MLCVLGALNHFPVVVIGYWASPIIVRCATGEESNSDELVQVKFYSV